MVGRWGMNFVAINGFLNCRILSTWQGVSSVVADARRDSLGDNLFQRLRILSLNSSALNSSSLSLQIPEEDSINYLIQQTPSNDALASQNVDPY
jgi:hypothetical protein